MGHPELSTFHMTNESNDNMSGKQKLSHILSEIFCTESSHPSAHHSIAQLVNSLDQHGMAMILIVFSLPSALPIPAPGYSTILSVPLLIIGIRMLFGHRTIWLPQSILNKSFDPKRLAKPVTKFIDFVKLVERFSHPRGVKLLRSGITTICLGLLIIALGCSMALPIPGTNTLPAGGIFLIGFALLEEDLALLSLGVLYSFVALTISCAIIFLGAAGVREVINWVL